MEVIKKIINIKKKIKFFTLEGKKIGFVPTMGYLHNGHLSLVKKLKDKVDIVVMSIYINPIQFGEGEDFSDYPRDLERDCELAKKAGVDILFTPSSKEIYIDHKSFVEIEGLGKNLCGARREGHFKGVATIVLKLLNIVKPDYAIFGLKDAQQLRVLEKMVEDFNLDVKILRGEILREKDGVAMSSRNKYLNEKERKEATILRKSLLFAKNKIEDGEKKAEIIIEEIKNFIKKESELAKIDYIEIVNFNNLEKLKELKGEILIAEAVYLGKTRLIDNVLLKL